jgi:hypothetical protein
MQLAAFHPGGMERPRGKPWSPVWPMVAHTHSHALTALMAGPCSGVMQNHGAGVYETGSWHLRIECGIIRHWTTSRDTSQETEEWIIM